MNKKWASKRITLNLASIEAERLEKYCIQTGRPVTDVIRELIRGLSVYDEVGNAIDALEEGFTINQSVVQNICAHSDD